MSINGNEKWESTILSAQRLNQDTQFYKDQLWGHLFSIIHICNLFRLIDAWETSNYIDDTTLYTRDMTIADAISSLEACSKSLFNWFDGNCLLKLLMIN